MDSFVTNIHIKTRSGKSLKSVVTSIVGRTDAAVVLQTLDCDGIVHD
ncbi:MAG: hypothetical protein H7318_09355 [Oligoflexus sp.]|nr:hypothetical protein [Oligoflexus sp.]